MKILIIGSGAREHALGWKLKKENPQTSLVFSPGNGGSSQIGENVPFNLEQGDTYSAVASRLKPDFTVVGPEGPLANGIVDDLSALGWRIFGPQRLAAHLESSKIFAKNFCRKNKIPTAKYEVFDQCSHALSALEKMIFPVVVKADGLAQGKGVVICEDKNSAAEALKNFMEQDQLKGAGKKVVVEEFLQGEEISLMAFFDGNQFVYLPPCRDYKKLKDGNLGPNTGGMGSVAPVALDPKFWDSFEKEIAEPFRRGLEREGISYRGVIYFGLMLSPLGIKVLEFNVRFGDPETQSLVALSEVPFFELMHAASEGLLNRFHHFMFLKELEGRSRQALCVVLASPGYPISPVVGHPITLPAWIPSDVCVFHAGTVFENGTLRTSGGRVLSVVGVDSELSLAKEHVYNTVKQIKFDGMQYRSDIGS